jgi:hypothetical protein
VVKKVDRADCEPGDAESAGRDPQAGRSARARQRGRGSPAERAVVSGGGAGWAFPRGRLPCMAE